jgi:hypothetical protein
MPLRDGATQIVRGREGSAPVEHGRDFAAGPFAWPFTPTLQDLKMTRSLVMLAVLTCSTFSFAADKKVERLFNAKCASCHGKDGKAQTENGKKMNMRDMGSAELQKLSDDDMKKAINEGVKREKDGVKQEMDAFKDDLKPGDAEALVKMTREFKK